MTTGPRMLAAQARDVPRVRLRHFPTPLEDLRNIDATVPGARTEVLVRRDDLLGDAHSRGAQRMIGCGPTTSNFVASLAQASASKGLECEVYVPGPITRNPSIDLAEVAEARVTSVPVTRHKIDAYVANRATQLTAQGTPAYVIPRGGATPVDAVGYALAAEELTEQRGDRESVAIVIPAGSCASAAGRLAGLTLLDSPHRLIAVSTNRQIDEAREVLLSLCAGVVELLGGTAGEPVSRLTLLDRADGTFEPSRLDAASTLSDEVGELARAFQRLKAQADELRRRDG